MVDVMEYANSASIEVIVGPMYAGKTEELIRRINRAKIAELNVISFKPKIDNRYNASAIVSHNGKEADCFVVETIEEMRAIVNREKFDIMSIDEVQFFPKEVVEFCQEIADSGKRVIVSGLDMDFKGKPFHIVPEMLAVAEHVSKLTAVCMKCKQPATRTQRIIDGRPAKASDPVILVGAKESYEARCRKCHEVRPD
jgi:thymidine kinase